MNFIRLKWIFRITYNADGSVKRHKAPLVANSYFQQQDIDFEESFSPVALFEMVRATLALFSNLGLHIYQFDVKSTSLAKYKKFMFSTLKASFLVKGRAKYT